MSHIYRGEERAARREVENGERMTTPRQVERDSISAHHGIVQLRLGL